MKGKAKWDAWTANKGACWDVCVLRLRLAKLCAARCSCPTPTPCVRHRCALMRADARCSRHGKGSGHERLHCEGERAEVEIRMSTESPCIYLHPSRRPKRRPTGCDGWRFVSVATPAGLIPPVASRPRVLLGVLAVWARLRWALVRFAARVDFRSCCTSQAASPAARPLASSPRLAPAHAPRPSRRGRASVQVASQGPDAVLLRPLERHGRPTSFLRGVGEGARRDARDSQDPHRKQRTCVSRGAKQSPRSRLTCSCTQSARPNASAPCVAGPTKRSGARVCCTLWPWRRPTMWQLTQSARGPTPWVASPSGARTRATTTRAHGPRPSVPTRALWHALGGGALKLGLAP